jgi:hypothetical protein
MFGRLGERREVLFRKDPLAKQVLSQPRLCDARLAELVPKGGPSLVYVMRTAEELELPRARCQSLKEVVHLIRLPAGLAHLMREAIRGHHQRSSAEVLIRLVSRT